MIHLRSTPIQAFMRCREEFRAHYLLRWVSAYASIHQELGIAAHKAVEMFWAEEPFTKALPAAVNQFAAIADQVHPTDKRRYEELKDIIPDMVACYFDNVEYQPQLMIEKEWSIITPWNNEITLGGRIDRVGGNGAGVSSSTAEGGQNAGPILLTDLKTCSEIDGLDAFGKKVGWERSYHDMMVKDFGIALYDWYLRQVGMTPTEIRLECLMKPYARYGKKARLIYIPLPEVIAYRERFDQQLQMITEEIYNYINRYSNCSPWPMTTTACSSKYGNCYLLAACNYGISRQTEKLYQIKELGVYEL